MTTHRLKIHEQYADAVLNGTKTFEIRKNGRVFVCEKGKPLMREVRYHCMYYDSTVIFLKKCEPKGIS